MSDVVLRRPAAAFEHAIGLLPRRDLDAAVRHAAWVARCVGRGDAAPLGPEDIAALAATLRTRIAAPGEVVFRSDQPATGVWIVRHGRVELAVGSGRRRVVVAVLRPGDVDGDIQLLLEMNPPYTARALEEATLLFLPVADFEALLARRPTIARRWLYSVAARIAASQERILELLGRSLPVQVARLLDAEAIDGRVPLPQRTLAAMLGVQRPSLNKILKEFERDRIIATGYAAIDIVDSARLQKLAGITRG
jgi:CRP/FNR family transcriptional regulator, cAMP and macrophage regulator